MPWAVGPCRAVRGGAVAAPRGGTAHPAPRPPRAPSAHKAHQTANEKRVCENKMQFVRSFSHSHSGVLYGVLTDSSPLEAAAGGEAESRGACAKPATPSAPSDSWAIAKTL